LLQDLVHLGIPPKPNDLVRDGRNEEVLEKGE
jgi:hypothetical protein